MTEHDIEQWIAAISSGQYLVGTTLPAGRVLAPIHGISQAVIRDVAGGRRAQGLVDRRQGAGGTGRSRTCARGYRSNCTDIAMPGRTGFATWPSSALLGQIHTP
ncbi:hypothetical protein [Mycetohabitans sp. B46]|uniref:hypothetical protein n=1 Tax=Mycetohabitans sp. B46 TaxID=2772536 RepID=UPI00307D4843